MLLRLLAAVGALFAMLNLGLAWTVRATGLLERPLDVQTRSMLQSRVTQAFSGPQRAHAVFVGDSLVFGAQLAERHAHWEQHTLSAQFARLASTQHRPAYGALNLGINGVLYSELACVVDAVLDHEPALLAINVSPRPFSEDFQVAIDQTERAFLCPPQASMPRVQGALELMRNALPVLRDRDLLQFQVLGAPPRAALLEQMNGWLARPPAPTEEPSEDDLEAAEVLKDMTWRTKAAGRLASVQVTSEHPQAKAMTRLLDLLVKARSTQIMLFYVAENLEPLTAQMDAERYRVEAQRFVQLVRSRVAGTKVRFVVVPQALLDGHYTDHIHLDERGYYLLAERLLATLRDGEH